MGKDNVPFHTVGFPVTLFGSKEPWKVVDHIKGLNWMNYYGGKFSTSGNRGIFMDQALELLPADYWRWYLLANAPESDDSNFTWEHFQAIVNHELADVFGNFVNRIAKFCAARLGAVVPEKGEYGNLEKETTSVLEQRLTTLTHLMEAMDFRKSAIDLRSIFFHRKRVSPEGGALDKDEDGSGFGGRFDSVCPEPGPGFCGAG